jgi:hypothetical protein
MIEMKVFRETTKDWTDKTPNHTYILSPDKQWMYGYVKASTGEIQEMGTPYRFKASGRKFKEVNNIWGFFPREELILIGETFKVPGSKGAVYTVANDRGSWTCTCPASKWQKGECKHITALKTKTI